MSGAVEKGRQRRSRFSEASTYSLVRLGLLASCGLAGPGFAQASALFEQPLLLLQFWMSIRDCQLTRKLLNDLMDSILSAASAIL